MQDVDNMYEVYVDTKNKKTILYLRILEDSDGPLKEPKFVEVNMGPVSTIKLSNLLLKSYIKIIH